MQASIATASSSLKLPISVTHGLGLSGTVSRPTQWGNPSVLVTPGQLVNLQPTHILWILQNCFDKISFEKKEKYWGRGTIFTGKIEIIRTLSNLSNLEGKQTYQEKRENITTGS